MAETMVLNSTLNLPDQSSKITCNAVNLEHTWSEIVYRTLLDLVTLLCFLGFGLIGLLFVALIFLPRNVDVRE